MKFSKIDKFWHSRIRKFGIHNLKGYKLITETSRRITFQKSNKKCNKKIIIDIFSNIGYLKNDKYHRKGDKPARFNLNYTYLMYYKNGKLHRKGDKPTTITNNLICYQQNSKWHRNGNKPAEIDLLNGIFYYFKNNKLYKKIESNRIIYFDKNGKYHRSDNKPAIIYFNTGKQEFWKHGVYKYFKK